MRKKKIKMELNYFLKVSINRCISRGKSFLNLRGKFLEISRMRLKCPAASARNKATVAFTSSNLVRLIRVLKFDVVSRGINLPS